MARRLYRLYRGPLTRALGVVFLANVFFFALLFMTQGDQCAISFRTRTAFETGELRTKDFLGLDARRGLLQWADCVVLQMVTNQDSSRLQRVLAPKVFRENEDWEGQCRVLRFLIEEWVDPDSLLPLRYSRYWHGYNAVAAFALRHLELRPLRLALSGAVWFAIGALVLASLRSGPRVRRTGLMIALAAATVWAVPYFGQGLATGPGDALLLLALAAIAARPRIAVSPGTIVPYAAGFGATVVFFEMLTGQLPIAVAWLAALTLAAARDESQPGADAAPTVAVAAATAFGLGAAATVGAKLILSGVLAEPQAGADFATRLGLYMNVPDYGSYSSRWMIPSLADLPGILLPFARLALQSPTLTFGNTRAGYGLVAAMGLAWLAAAILGWRVRHTERGRDMLILVGAALVPAAWVCLLPSHAYIHATFMVRILVVPISLAPLALCWPLVRASRR